MAETTALPIYAVCNECQIDLPTPDAASAHGLATMKPTARTDGITAQGHGWHVVNPTPQERARSKVRWAIDDAVQRCMEQLDDYVSDNRLTPEEVTDGLRGYPDFADAWDDWLADNDL